MSESAFGTPTYLVRSVSNQYAGISRLDNTYLNTDGEGVLSRGPRIEGVAIFKLSSYYLIGSHLTGWSPNAAVLCLSESRDTLDGALWVECYNPTSSSSTYNSQSTFVLRMLHDNATHGAVYVYMFMADIWNYPNVGNATYLWLPFVFANENNSVMAKPTVPYLQSWKISDYTVPVP